MDYTQLVKAIPSYNITCVHRQASIPLLNIYIYTLVRQLKKHL